MLPTHVEESKLRTLPHRPKATRQRTEREEERERKRGISCARASFLRQWGGRKADGKREKDVSSKRGPREGGRVYPPQ